MTKTMTWAAGDVAQPWSRVLVQVLAVVLNAAGKALTHAAVKMYEAQAVRRPAVEVVEFHPIYRDAGAPEGALYVNGELVGTIEGVTRL